jgi:glycine betaine/choline ABC-type transport system substrate-binding protein
MHLPHRALVLSVACLLGAATLAGCGGGSDTEAAAGGNHLVIGAASTPENELLAHIYGGALERAGAVVEYRTGLGDRSALEAAVAAGTIDVAVLIESEVTAKDGVTPTTAAPAEAGDALVVAKTLANDKGILQTSDLASKLGGFRLSDVVTDKGKVTAGGEVVGRFRASDPDLAPSGKLQVLVDDAHLLPAGHVEAVVRTAKATAGVVRAVEDTSKRVTLEHLQELNKQVAEGTSPAKAAEGFLAPE